jgi:hypothetical protein
VRPGEPSELQIQFLGGQQALPLGIRIGRDQRECGQVVPGDPAGTAGVEHVRPVSHPQHEPVVLGGDRHPQHGALVQFPAHTARIDNGLEQRPNQTQLVFQIIHREVPVEQQF